MLLPVDMDRNEIWERLVDLSEGATAERQVVLLNSADKCNFCFMDWVGLKIQTRCHVQSALRQWGSILCLNQETYLLFPESPLLSITVRIWVKVGAAADGFLLPIHPIRIENVKTPICYVICCQLHLWDSHSFQSASLVWPSLTFLCLWHSEPRWSLLSLPVSVA